MDRPEQVAPGTLERALAEGAFVNGTRAGFQEGYYAEPDELRTVFESLGFATRIRGFGEGARRWSRRSDAPDGRAFFRSRFLLKILVQKMEE